MSARDAGAIAARCLAMLALYFGIRGIGSIYGYATAMQEGGGAINIVIIGTWLLNFAFAWVLWTLAPNFYNPDKEENRVSGITAQQFFKVLLAALGVYILIVNGPQLLGTIIAGNTTSEVQAAAFDKPYRAELIEDIASCVIGLLLLMLNIPLGSQPEQEIGSEA